MATATVKISVRLVAVTAVSLGVSVLSSLKAAEEQPERVSRALLVLYDFAEESGATIHDRSPVGEPLHLAIDKPDAVRWSNGALTVQSSVLIASPGAARKVVDALKKSDALSIEAWVRPANTSQEGPARIVTLSADTGQRNFTLGQQKDACDVRLRAGGSDRNGMPSTSSPAKSLRPRLTHVVYTRDAKGAAVIFIDGKQVANRNVGGKLDNWDGGYRLALANEITGDRPWLGEFHLVAIYSRALSGNEVQQNYTAGASAGAVSQEDLIAAARRRAFETQVAPLFAKHCLECHDTALKKGGLDLSRREAALAGGESGAVIMPGKAAESPLWELVSSGDMPKDRAPLEADQQAVLREWLEDGAAWPVDVIDPANYRHAGSAGQVWVQRLTVTEYIETVRSAVGVDVAAEARELLPPDLRADGFSNTAYNLGVDLKHIEAYNRLAEIIVGRLDVPAFARRFSESRKFDDDKMREFVAALGKWLLRGPLNENEINLYRGIASTVSSAGGDYDDAVRFIIEAMLQSPRFVYRIEEQRGDGGPRPADPYELASRLSYILWGAPPDEELFGAAERGELADRAELEKQVQRMLQDPRAIERSLQFVSEWLNLGRLANLRPDSEKFPRWDAQLAADMREETLAYFKEVVWTQNRPLTDLLNAQVTYATPRLAEHYGLTPAGEGLSLYDLSQIPARGGLLTQGSVLTIGGDEASMVTRGLFVLHELLRGTINAPPPCVNTTPPPTKAGLTQRGIAEARIADEKCGVCHGRFDALAFGLEKFDGVGAFHERDRHGNPLRDDGAVLFPGEAQPVKYSSSAELMDRLAGSPRVRESLTWKVAQFAVGRPLGAADAATLAAIDKSAQEGGGTYAALIREIVLSDLVRMTGTERGP